MPIASIVEGIEIVRREVQKEKLRSSTVLKDEGNSIDTNELQPEKVPMPNAVIPATVGAEAFTSFSIRPILPLDTDLLDIALYFVFGLIVRSYRC